MDERLERYKIQINYYYEMAKSEYLGLNIDQTMRKLKVAFKDKDIKWSDEFEHSDYYDFMLSYKWAYVLCKVDKVYPYNARFRLIWSPRYISVKINKLVESVCEVLFERFTPNTSIDDTTEL